MLKILSHPIHLAKHYIKHILLSSAVTAFKPAYQAAARARIPHHLLSRWLCRDICDMATFAIDCIMLRYYTFYIKQIFQPKITEKLIKCLCYKLFRNIYYSIYMLNNNMIINEYPQISKTMLAHFLEYFSEC